jgi:uncharacterized membrane protein YfcA
MNETGVAVASLALGLLAGVLSGMFGIGGGLVIVPALILLFREGEKIAVGTSLFALLWPVGLLGVREYWKEGQLRAAQGLWIALGLFIGAYFGARVTLALPPALVKRLYALFLVTVGLYLLFSTKTNPAPAPAPIAAPAPAGEPPQVH